MPSMEAGNFLVEKDANMTDALLKRVSTSSSC